MNKFAVRASAVACAFVVIPSQDLAGKRLPSSPEWKLNVGWDYDIDLGSMPFEGVFSGSYVWQSEQNFSLNQDPETIQESYGILNQSVRRLWQSARHRDLAGARFQALRWRACDAVVLIADVTDKQGTTNDESRVADR